MRDFAKQIGRLRVEYYPAHGDSMCVQIKCPEGWNDSCRMQTFTISLEEAKDLWYALDRLYAHVNR